MDDEQFLRHIEAGRRNMRRTTMILAFMTFSVTSSSALAQDEKEKDKERGRGAITLTEVTITGRIEKPIAAVDVARITPRLTLAELRQPFMDRIEQAIYKSPF